MRHSDAEANEMCELGDVRRNGQLNSNFVIISNNYTSFSTDTMKMIKDEFLLKGRKTSQLILRCKKWYVMNRRHIFFLKISKEMTTKEQIPRYNMQKPLDITFQV